MSREIYGLIHDYYPRERVISIYKKEKIEYYYFSKSLESYIKEAESYCSGEIRNFIETGEIKEFIDELWLLLSFQNSLQHAQIDNFFDYSFDYFLI